MKRAYLLGAVLWLVTLFSAACAGSADPSSDSGEAPAGATAAPSASASATAVRGAGAAIFSPGGHQRSRCASCHTAEDREKPKWKELAGKMGHDVAGMLEDRTTCNCCHLGEVKGFGEPFEARCLDCHADIKVTIPKMGQQHCVGCHTLGAGDASDMVLRAWECQKCHADNQGTSAAIDVHGGEDCANCHRPHDEPWTEPRDCTECHEGQKGVHHGTLEGKQSSECVDCHSPHEKAGAAAEKCASCHEKKNPDIVRTARFENGHDTCTTCHAPHEFEKAGAKECTSCHQAQRTMTGRGQDKHADCQSCHAPHDVRGTAASSCNKCHGNVSSNHPDPKGMGCVACHDPHPSTTATGTAAAVAAGSCAVCHSTVKNQSGAHGEQLACNKCHSKHREADKPTVGCKDCHATELARTALNPKHSECTSCHTGSAHRPQTNTAACTSCHAAEQSTAPKGHADCNKCHDSHSGKQIAGQTCQTCHAAKAAGAIALGHKDCASCHRPHGPDGPASPPTCTTCHQSNKLVGLHTLKGHDNCSACHNSAHAPPKSDRATCVGCHANEQDHQPDATTCGGCHRFKGG